MKQHASSENSNASVLFPFLAVLLCTMGALLVLLVVLAQSAGRRAVVELAEPAPEAPPVVQVDNTEADELARQLDAIYLLQKNLRKYQEQAKEKVQEEQNRLSHLEDHTRRLEHELARLSLAAQQLEATEKDQSVDQQQAENELARLQELIEETQQQLEELREQATGERSYAIVPYKGPNGTFRQPIYIECCKEGVILRPEGIRLVASDFSAAHMPGNPLAAAIRASREYLNAKAAKAGLPEPPDPYPLLIVRPEGIQQFYHARTAVTSWDSDYGYEFIGSGDKLTFPNLADPQLAQVQNHAVLNAREQLAHLIRSAPSRFHGIGSGGGSSMASGGETGSYGNGAGSGSEPNSYGLLAQSAEGESGSGNGSASGQSGGSPGTEQGDYQFGAAAGNASEGGEAFGGEFGEDSLAGGVAGEASDSGGGARGEAGSKDGENAGAGSEASSLAEAGGQSVPGGSPGGSSSSGSSTGSASGGQAQGSPGSMNASSSQVKSIAESQGKNWAIEGGARGAVPIRRPIQVVVRENQLALLPSRHDRDGVGATGTLISLDQSTKKISDEFVEALRARVNEWGLAGNGLYWRPVLELRIGPGAAQTARGVTQLLKGSGVEVKISESASLSPQVQALKGGRANATR